MSQASAPRSAGQMIGDYFRDFGVLRETRAEFWGIQIVNILDCTFYFALMPIATLFLSTDLGMSDKNAGYVYAAFTSAITILLTFSGMITDWLGIRRSLRISMISMMFLRAAALFVGLAPSIPHRGLIVTALLVLMAPFMAGIQTIFQSAIQRYTTKRSRSAGFNLWYLCMNIGAAIGAGSIDVIRLKLRVSNAHVFTMGVVLAALCWFVTEVLIRREDQLKGADEVDEPANEQLVRKKPLQIAKDVIREPAFFRLVVLISLVLGVRAVYAYMNLLMPKYWERTIGPDATIGILNMINPVGIFVGLVLFIPLANKFRVFSMLIYGSMISALALVPMSVPWECYGTTIAKAHYAMALVCMVLLTIGEVLWSPKLNEYTAAIAPKGQEGTYLGLSMLPWFAAKTLVSAFSGHLLERWSPETVTVDGAAMPLQQALVENRLPYWQTPSAMWLWLGLYAFVGCLIALFLRRWLTKGAKV